MSQGDTSGRRGHDQHRHHARRAGPTGARPRRADHRRRVGVHLRCPSGRDPALGRRPGGAGGRARGQRGAGRLGWGPHHGGDPGRRRAGRGQRADEPAADRGRSWPSWSRCRGAPRSAWPTTRSPCAWPPRSGPPRTVLAAPDPTSGPALEVRPSPGRRGRRRRAGAVHQRHDRGAQAGGDQPRRADGPAHGLPGARSTIERRPGVGIMCVPSFHVGGMLGLLREPVLRATRRSCSPGSTPGSGCAGGRRTGRRLGLPGADHAGPHPRPSRPEHHRPQLACASVSYGAAAAPVELVRRAMHQWPARRLRQRVRPDRDAGRLHDPVAGRPPRPGPGRLGRAGRCPGVEVRVVDPDTARRRGRRRGGRAVGARRRRTCATAGSRPATWPARTPTATCTRPAGAPSGINRGGEKFAPHEVAEVIRSHPAVREAAVAGLPDRGDGGAGRAAIVARRPAADGGPTLDELRDWCRARLAPFKLPEVVVVVDALPSNELGKLPRRAGGRAHPASQSRPGGRTMTLYLHEIHHVIGQHEDEFEAAFRDRGRVDGPARPGRATPGCSGTPTRSTAPGRAYRVITITAVDDGAAWERLAAPGPRRRPGATGPTTSTAAPRRHRPRSSLPGPLVAHRRARPGVDPAEPADHEPTLFMEDTGWPHVAARRLRRATGEHDYHPMLASAARRHPPARDPGLLGDHAAAPACDPRASCGSASTT